MKTTDGASRESRNSQGCHYGDDGNQKNNNTISLEIRTDVKKKKNIPFRVFLRLYSVYQRC